MQPGRQVTQPKLLAHLAVGDQRQFGLFQHRALDRPALPGEGIAADGDVFLIDQVVVVFSPGADQLVHQRGDVVVDFFAHRQREMGHEFGAGLLFVHLQQHPPMHVRQCRVHVEGLCGAGNVSDLPILLVDDAQNIGGDVPRDIQSADTKIRRR